MAAVTVTKAGVVTLVGTLADGTAISASSALSQTDSFPLFAPLYNKLGFLSGFVQLDSAQPASDLAATDLRWLRPFQDTAQYYPYGWTDPIKVDLLGAKYIVTAGQSVFKAVGGTNLQTADADGNVALVFRDGSLTDPVYKAANLSTADVATKVPDNDTTFTLLVNRATGALTGTFTHTDDSLPAFNSIILQKGSSAGAYGHFLTKQPVLIDYTGKSGGVKILGQP